MNLLEAPWGAGYDWSLGWLRVKGVYPGVPLGPMYPCPSQRCVLIGQGLCDWSLGFWNRCGGPQTSWDPGCLGMAVTQLL